MSAPKDQDRTWLKNEFQKGIRKKSLHLIPDQVRKENSGGIGKCNLFLHQLSGEL